MNKKTYYNIGQAKIIKEGFVGKDGQKLDTLEIELFDPINGNKIRANGIIPEQESKFKVEVRKTNTDGSVNVRSLSNKFIILQFNGIKTSDDQLKYDYPVPVKLKEKVVSKVEQKISTNFALDDEEITFK